MIGDIWENRAMLSLSVHLPRIEFGAGAIRKLPAIAAQYGKRLLIITGAAAFTDSEAGKTLFNDLQAAGFTWEIRRVTQEPSPQWVDATVAAFAAMPDISFDAVIGIGGGSPLDAAKAVAGLLKPGNSVMDHLEGVGAAVPYQGEATPFIAVPTTAGTGSEATKNAVLSVSGEHGFKKSFRDDKLVAAYAIVDPDLLATCPPAQIAANGMDAFTQLMEAYVSTRANPLTDALALAGMAAVRDSLLAFYADQTDSVARSKLAYASLLSGICLAQTGLGSVHGVVAPLGAFHPIGHGVGCGMLVTEATRLNIDLLEAREPNNPALAKYTAIGTLFRGGLVHTLQTWAQQLHLPRLADFGVTEADIPKLVAHSRGSSMQTNPIALSDADIAHLIRVCL
jgi:alcohol dehydrogenase